MALTRFLKNSRRVIRFRNTTRAGEHRRISCETCIGKQSNNLVVDQAGQCCD